MQVEIDDEALRVAGTGSVDYEEELNYDEVDDEDGNPGQESNFMGAQYY